MLLSTAPNQAYYAYAWKFKLHMLCGNVKINRQLAISYMK